MNRFLSFYYQQIKPLFLQKPLFTPASKPPFFILSSGRSGSTLLRKLLLSHAAVNIPPESGDLIPKLLKFYLRYNHKPWNYIAGGCMEIFNNENEIRYWDLDPASRLKELVSPGYEDRSLSGIIHFLYKIYGQKHNFDYDIWGDKTPFLLFRLSWINMVYPQAKYIFLIRDGRAVVNSFLKMGGKYTLEEAVSRWRRSMEEMERQRKRTSEEQVLTLHYEDLVSSTEAVLNRTYRFLGVEPFKGTRKDIYLGDDVLPHHKNIWSDIGKGSVEKWKQELTPAQIETINKLAGHQLKALRYEV